MIELQIEGLEASLTRLEVAGEALARAKESLERAKLPYVGAIQILTEAMEQDGNVLEARGVLDEYQDLYEEAEREAQGVALGAWMNGETTGRKEWTQVGWEVRLRTIRTPIIGDLVKFLTNLVEIGAVEALVKRVTLNKANTVSLHGTLEGGLEGLEVEESTTCSLKAICRS